jgi:type I restriction enzyme S subunit
MFYLLGFLSLEKLDRSTAIPGLNRDDLYAQKVPIPPLPEQHRIVAEIETQFSRLDAGVAALKRVQAALRRYKASVLKAACEGRLVPTEAELARAGVGAGPPRPYEPASALLERILAERRAKWERANPGKRYVEPKGVDGDGSADLPEGWVWATVAMVSQRMQYGTSEKTSTDVVGIPVLRMGNIKEGVLDFSDLKYLPEDLPSLTGLMLEDGDILFNRTNSAELVGKSAVYRESHPSATFASYLIRVTIDRNCEPYLLVYYINSVFGRSYIKSVVSQQVGQANVNGTKLANMPFPLPPMAEQHRIVAEVERRLSVAQEVEGAVAASLRRAERLRQSILKQAFAGRLVAQEADDEPGSALLERMWRQ